MSNRFPWILLTLFVFAMPQRSCASRDDTVRYHLADISLERRSGYDWYGTWAEPMLKTEYPAWREKHKVKNVLKK